MKIGSYEVYREDGICVLREEKSYETNKKPCGIKESKDLYELCTNVFEMHKLTCEKMLIICVDHKAIPRAIFEFGGGSYGTCCLSESALLTRVLLTGYPCFFLVHNHPSLVSEPSREDIDVTRAIKRAAEAVGLRFLDHMIVGDDFYSFQSEGTWF